MEGSERDVFVEIKDLQICEKQEDELNSRKKKITLKFSLTKGSYATMAVRKIVG